MDIWHVSKAVSNCERLFVFKASGHWVPLDVLLFNDSCSGPGSLQPSPICRMQGGPAHFSF